MSELNANLKKKDYGGDYEGHFLEQYKLYVDSIEKNTDRRGRVNTFFLTLQSAVLTAIGLIYSSAVENEMVLEPKWVILFPLVLLLAISFAWGKQMYQYRNLNKYKFKVLELMEKQLPAAMFVELEWGMFEETYTNRKHPKAARFFNRLLVSDYLLPVVFGLIYVVGAIIFLFS